MAGNGSLDMFEAAFCCIFDIFAGLSALVVIPFLGVCICLILLSDFSKLPVYLMVFAANAWSAYLHHGSHGIVPAVIMAVGTALIARYVYRTLIREILAMPPWYRTGF